MQSSYCYLQFEHKSSFWSFVSHFLNFLFFSLISSGPGGFKPWLSHFSLSFLILHSLFFSSLSLLISSLLSSTLSSTLVAIIAIAAPLNSLKQLFVCYHIPLMLPHSSPLVSSLPPTNPQQTMGFTVSSDLKPPLDNILAVFLHIYQSKKVEVLLGSVILGSVKK